MFNLRRALKKIRLFHWCLIALVPVAVLVIGIRLEIFPKAEWFIKRSFAMTLGPAIKMTPNLNASKQRLRLAAGGDLGLPLKDPRIIIYKSQRRAELLSGQTLIKTYKLALGGHTAGPKEKIGDDRTPEGQYYLCSCLYRSVFHIFLGLNFPNSNDAESCLKRGDLSELDYNRIRKAEQAHRRPPWNTMLGGAVGLHGGGTNMDWTMGCIAFDDKDIEELCVATRYWTPVEIRP